MTAINQVQNWSSGFIHIHGKIYMSKLSPGRKSEQEEEEGEEADDEDGVVDEGNV